MGFHYTVSRDVGTNSGVACDSNIMEKNDYKSLREFQNFLILRGVIFSNTKKADLIDLCDIAASLNIEVDPDGLVEDRSDILKQNLTNVTGEN